jgi:hypothetical protein
VAQGYLIAQPMPGGLLLDWLKAYRPRMRGFARLPRESGVQKNLC